ncbi:putative alpha-1,3-mannosyltransferase Mnt4p [[Candida] jaroonii]|uniref:Alpha-1,3-mannosyltransferase Mnt4p n=1 Tax=[Candida] jaroonii TaxID=467808 RepID=A0ACA9Y8H1_9ASCO|nr:putative alpha-1,3-mannosyltransferase Mnt4p [[Candida] jaroonii]
MFKRRLLLSTVIILIIYTSVILSNRRKIGEIKDLKNVEPLQDVEDVENLQIDDLMQRRKQFINPIYRNWDPDTRSNVKDQCDKYFNELDDTSGFEIIDLEHIQSYEFDPLIYKEKYWLRKYRREMRMRLRQEGLPVTGEDIAQLHQRYRDDLKYLSNYENQVVQEFNHKRVFGSCLSSLSEDHCRKFQKKLYPWLSSEFPTAINWRSDKSKLFDKSDGCFIRSLAEQSKGRGIVIPFIGDDFKSDRLVKLNKLVNVLRALKNDLPIQITFMRNSLTKEDMAGIIKNSRSELVVPTSLKSHSFGEDDFPKQNIEFVDMTDVMNQQQHPLVAKSYKFNNPTFLTSLSLLFNSFEDIILLSLQTIPLTNLNDLYDNDNYRKYGQLFFKNPSHFNHERKTTRPGFQETNDLIRTHFMPNKFDNFFFGINQVKDDKIFDLTFRENVKDLMDNGMIVINKPKHMSGLLISCNFQLYKIIEGRFESVKDVMFQDIFWLGLTIAGTNDRVYFNRHYPGVPGKLTPAEEKDFNKMTTSHELCSSSWCQINEADDYTLIYITTHQFENWLNEPTFKENLLKRFPENPLTVETVLKPPEMTKKIHVIEYKEPKSGWSLKDDFSNFRGAQYWCGYDIIGGPKTNIRGLILDYGKKWQTQFDYLVNVWLDVI